MTVAAAAPAIPYFNLKMNNQSKTVLLTAPISMVSIAVRGYPDARIKLFIAPVAMKKGVPNSKTR